MSKKFGEGVNPMNRKWSRSKTILTCAFLVLAIVLCDARAVSALPTGKAIALPMFARKYGLPCSACHTAWPELNNFGQVFRDNGYQLMNDRDSPIWQNPSYFPISFRITPNWHRESTNNQVVDTVPGNGDAAGIGYCNTSWIRPFRNGFVVGRNTLQEHLIHPAAFVGLDGGVAF